MLINYYRRCAICVFIVVRCEIDVSFARRAPVVPLLFDKCCPFDVERRRGSADCFIIHCGGENSRRDAQKRCNSLRCKLHFFMALGKQFFAANSRTSAPMLNSFFFSRTVRLSIYALL